MSGHRLRILVLCPHYEPDSAPTGEVISAICGQWTARGHQVEVVTSLPWYRDHAVAEGWSGRLVRTQRESWGRIRRWHPFPADKGRLAARAAAFAGFTVLAGADAVVAARRCDAVLAMSPPLTLGAAGWAAALRGRVPLVFNVQDVFPDAAVETGVLRSPRVVAAARRLERWMYRRADAVTVLSEGMAVNVRAKLGDSDSPDKVVVISNAVDPARITPSDRHNPYRADLGPGGDSDKTVVMYAGNLGHSQPLELVVAAAEQFALWGRTDVQFVVNGDGVNRSPVAAAADRLDNLHLVGWQPPERLGEVLAAADLQLVLLRAGLGESSVPSKVYSVLAAGRPVLASVDRGSEVERLLAASGAGRTVDPDDAAAFCAAVAEMVDDPAGLAAMGRRGRAFAENAVGPQQVAEQYLELFGRLMR
ncbi:glycosyltransferase family 4 protein [Candidatus Poriferisocius sp.]|uniref:glycosyltransferase family 4 protein n=1 Tax=Candidatus Poriferisocius sp. TaxID=3101276 RepID=UPI003B019A4A